MSALNPNHTLSGGPAIEVSGLVCGYGEQTILRDVTFNVARGEIFFIVGPGIPL